MSSKKYVIEIEEQPFHKYYPGFGDHEEVLYRAVGFKSLVFDKNGLQKLTPMSNEVAIEYLQSTGWMQHHDKELTDPYVETDDLKVGDEVSFITIGGECVNGVVTGYYTDSREYRVMREEGSECYCFKAHKTGRHFDEIEAVFAKMREK